MTPFEQTLESLIRVDIWFLAKLLVLAALGVYLAFAVVLVRQVKLMVSVLNGNLNLPLKALALGHLVVAGMVFLLALTIL